MNHPVTRRVVLSLVLVVACLPGLALAHCQVPCGIYGDQLRFEAMLEDTATITKAIAQIEELAGTHDATGHNQLARWVATKESHATSIQKTIADYFMAQRIKPDSGQYVKQLTSAHAVTIAAMKAKQAADPETAEALKASILALYEAYEGKPYQASHSH